MEVPFFGSGDKSTALSAVEVLVGSVGDKLTVLCGPLAEAVGSAESLRGMEK